jgi:hypothetical protein
MKKSHEIIEKIKSFENQHRDFKISYGGDGTLLKTFHEHPNKYIIPIRDYGRCEKHENLLDELLKCNDEKITKKYGLFNIRSYDLLECDNEKALSEIQITSANPTQCLRFNVYINNNKFMDNVIANGVILSTTIGATGYFKSVARTIFREGFGLGFICPTYGINNIILKRTDVVNIEFIRSGKAHICWDNIIKELNVEEGMNKKFIVSLEHASIFGYDIFMCQQCRNNRNSTNVNDKYVII